MFPWYLSFSWRHLWSFPFYCFPLFLCIDSEEGFLISPWYSLKLCIQMGRSFLFSFAFHLFSQLFVKPPQRTILPFCIWSWLLPPVQCHEPQTIVLQTLCLSDLVSWIYLSLPLYHQGSPERPSNWKVGTFQPYRLTSGKGKGARDWVTQTLEEAVGRPSGLIGTSRY